MGVDQSRINKASRKIFNLLFFAEWQLRPQLSNDAVAYADVTFDDLFPVVPAHVFQKKIHVALLFPYTDTEDHWRVVELWLGPLFNRKAATNERGKILFKEMKVMAYF